MLYRAFTPDLELRTKGDGRTIYGIAVPWDAMHRIDQSRDEVWRSGAFNHQLGAPYRVRFAAEHVALGGTLIGATKLLRNDAAGQYGEWRVAKTPKGDETLELFKEGALRELSIGFRERPGGTRYRGRLAEMISADLFEVALTLEGAFGDLAVAAGVRTAAVTDGTSSDAGAEGDLRIFLDGKEIDATPFESMIRTVGLEEARQVLAGMPDLPALPDLP